MPKKQAPAAPDPNRLVRVRAGTYRSEDDRFEVRDGGTGWFLTDRQQTNEFGQELVLGPYATLAAVRDGLPEARRTTLRPLPRRSRPTGSGRGRPKAAPPPAPAPVHRLRQVLVDAARHRFPPSDLAVEIVSSPPGKSDAVVAFSGHSVVATNADPDEVRTHLPADDPGGPMSAPFLTWLGLQLGWPPGSLDVVLAADGAGQPNDDERPLEAIDPADDAIGWAASRIDRADRYRSEVAVHADADRGGIVVIGLGLAERLEVSIEVRPDRRGRGRGASLARAARGLAPEGEALFAQVAPGNVASLRAFLRAGYRPIGAEVLFLRER